MNDKKATKSSKDQKKGAANVKDLEPAKGPKGGGMTTTVRPDTLPRGGWDGNHNLTSL
jgi:hypothetical protein